MSLIVAGSEVGISIEEVEEAESISWKSAEECFDVEEQGMGEAVDRLSVGKYLDRCESESS